ncbi:MAG TPA: Mpo1-like protein [Ramlibacter sp.]|jgi:uncharacterized membrane protein YGL010W|nr:Mpo1-like protein [Ramlibacter sp.]
MNTMTGEGTAAATRRVDQLLAHYGESHRDPRNGAIHCVAIPLIMISLVGLIYSIHPWAAYAFLAASLVYYARIGSWVFLGTMAVVSAATIALVQSLGVALLPVSVAVFVVAWIAQFVGHKFEGRKPSFLDDLQYLWVGPLFVLAKLFLRLGIRW